MKNLILLINTLIIQVLDKRSSEFLFSSTKQLFMLICLVLAVIIMVIIPIMLSFNIFINSRTLNEYKSKFNAKCLESNEGEDSSFDKDQFSIYCKAYKNLMKNSFGLFAWNVSSLVYILTGFESVEAGLKEYFYFPFKKIVDDCWI